jgi:hypothetical protein
MINIDKNKKEAKEYDLAHKLGKLLCAIINSVLFALIFNVDHIFLFFLVNLTYFFGVNTFARLIERVLHYKKKHEVI